MISEKINNTHDFMSKLFIDTFFDNFLTAEASIKTYNTFTIDGHLNKYFYSEEEFCDLSEKKFSQWKDLRPICFNIIKGTKPPVKFKIIFALDKQIIRQIISDNKIDFISDNVNELYLNISYENGQVTITTGCSLKVFTLDKSLEKSYDSYILNLLSDFC
ncbi:MAG: hypothetical protein IIT48_11010 [Lachnospiraceae bacterium]|nr:hypothetical protein [Lachnospiraceae bacterium]